MQQTIVRRTGLLAVAAIIAAALVAISMSFGAQTAWAQDAKGLAVGETGSATDNTVVFTVKNVTSIDGVTLTGVKTSAKKVAVPEKLTVNGVEYAVTTIAPGAFKNCSSTTITLPSTIGKIKKNAFKGSKAKTLIVKTKKLTKKKVKGSLKGSKVKTVKVKVGNKKANKKYVKKYKKIFTKKNAGKKVKVKR
jgi:hypothetical protein